MLYATVFVTKIGWGDRTRTYECGDQNPVPYHLATPQCERAILQTLDLLVK
jgi:hypothetical protein